MPARKTLPSRAARARRASGTETGSKVFTFILPIALIEQIDAIASEERRSRVRTVEIALEDYARQHHAERAA
jgi:hypothetical protein